MPAGLQLHGSRLFHLLDIREEPPLGILHHSLPSLYFILALPTQFRNEVHLDSLIQLVEFPGTVILNINRVHKVVYVKFWRRPMQGVR